MTAIKKQCIEELFPCVLKDGTILLFDYMEYEADKQLCIYCHDDDGYKYHLRYDSLKAVIRRGTRPCRFFYGNIHTEYNINLYLEQHNVDWVLDDNIELSGAARILYKFIDSSGNRHTYSWNNLQKLVADNERPPENSLRAKNALLTKDYVTQYIRNLSIELGRPPKQKDFVIHEGADVGIRYIERYWGTFNNMLKDLDFPSSVERRTLFHCADEYIPAIHQLCDAVYKAEGRKLITKKDFKKHQNVASYSAYQNACKKDNTSVAEIVTAYGYEFQKPGCGMYYVFNDGEKVYSSFEYAFSNFLRQNHIFYERDIPYSQIAPWYDGNMNCDYKLNINNYDVYVELAGILCKSAFEKAYLNHTEIGSCSKDEYREKLYLKEQLLEKTGYKYYILLPSQMVDEEFFNIINNDMV